MYTCWCIEWWIEAKEMLEFHGVVCTMFFRVALFPGSSWEANNVGFHWWMSSSHIGKLLQCAFSFAQFLEGQSAPTLDTDGVCVSGALRSSEKWWGHTDIAGVVLSIRLSKWVEGKVYFSPWSQAPIRPNPCHDGGQVLPPSDSGCTGEGVGLTQSKGTCWRGDKGNNSEWICRIVSMYVYTWLQQMKVGWCDGVEFVS